jgi:ATP-dependent RNA helicase DeaD
METMADFKDLGLREELLRVLEDEELERPTSLQEGVIPALRRGTNVVARASAGAGKTLAYGLGVLDRLQPRAEPAEEGDEGGEGEAEQDGVRLRFLVVTATGEEAQRVAVTLFPYARAAGLGITVAGGSWGTGAREAEVLVSPAGELMGAVRGSSLKLEDVEAVVVDGAATIAELGDWDAVDAMLDLLPRDAQRVVLSAAFPERVQDLVDRRVKRALLYPAEAVLPEDRAPVEGAIGYVLVTGREKLEVLARQLTGPKEEGGAPPVIFCRSDERAADLAEQLSVRGFLVGAADDSEVDVALAASDATRAELVEEAEDGLGQTLSFDVPPDAATLKARHGGDPDAVVLVEPRELPHLQEIARMAQLSTRSVPLPVDPSATAKRLEAFRQELRQAAREEDLAAQMLVLEPLLEELSLAEIAAAAVALLRHRRPAADAAGSGAAGAAAGTGAAAGAREGRGAGSVPAGRAEAGAPPATWARLYVGVGSRDEIRPGDLVGALAGEANIPGAKIGKIEIRDSFSIVEVEAGVADQVIRAVNGTTIKGRSVRVDYDRGAERGRRGTSGPPRRQSRGGDAPPRRNVRRPPER